MTRILFIHNTVMWYRIPFFKRIAKLYSVKFLFNHADVSKTIYGVEKSDKIKGVDYQFMSNHLGIAWGLIREVWSDYDILVGGSWDSIPETLESLYYLSVAWIRRKPIILWREDWGWEDTSLKSRLLKPLIRWMVRTSSAIVVPGSKHREYFLSLTSNPDKIFLMPNASNLKIQDTKSEGKVKQEDSNSFRKELGLEGKKIVLFVGRLIERKGVQYLLQAMNQVKTDNAVLLIVGEGEFEDELKSMVNDLGLTDKTIFTGKIPEDELFSYYILSDLVVVPSITHGIGDPWVLVLNEAMIFRTPVIATDAVGAASDMIKEGENGFIVPEKDAKALTKAIDTILRDDDLRLKMGEKSYDIIQKEFRYDNMVEGFRDAIEYSLRQ